MEAALEIGFLAAKKKFIEFSFVHSHDSLGMWTSIRRSMLLACLVADGEDSSTSALLATLADEVGRDILSVMPGTLSDEAGRDTSVNLDWALSLWSLGRLILRENFFVAEGSYPS